MKPTEKKTLSFTEYEWNCRIYCCWNCLTLVFLLNIPFESRLGTPELLVRNLEFPLLQVLLCSLSLGALPLRSLAFFPFWLSHTFFTYFQLQHDHHIMFLQNSKRIELLWASKMYIFCVWGQNLSAANGTFYHHQAEEATQHMDVSEL